MERVQGRQTLMFVSEQGFLYLSCISKHYCRVGKVKIVTREKWSRHNIPIGLAETLSCSLQANQRGFRAEHNSPHSYNKGCTAQRRRKDQIVGTARVS